MAQLSIQSNLSNLTLRVISAAVILPVVFAALWYGGMVFAALLALFAAFMCWEWSSLCGARSSVEQVFMIAAGAAMPLMTHFGQANTGLLVLGAVGIVVLAIAAFRRIESKYLLALGLPYIGATMVAAVWLRADSANGFATLVWVILIVVATDVGAYFTGRNFGGPKLAPRISPNKTWSGLIGGMACAGLTGMIVGYIYVGSVNPTLGLLSLALGAIAQGGDLVESGLKRHFNVKDASQLIPGHGGFLDRFDGYLTVMPAVALMTLVFGGSPVGWQ